MWEIMSLIPAFEIGLWNAWIFMLYQILTFPIFFRLAKKNTRGMKEPKLDLSKTKKIFLIFSKLILAPAAIYSIFLPLKLGTIWFHVGLPITLVGLVTYTIVLVNWAKTPPGKPVARGLYRYSRHPMYITSFLFFLGLGVATASWLFLLFAIVFIIGAVVFIDFEEKSTLKQFGDAYRKYMNRTPRWIGIPKSGPPDKFESS